MVGYSSMNAAQKRHSKREKEGFWRRSLSKIVILNTYSLPFWDKTAAFCS